MQRYRIQHRATRRRGFNLIEAAIVLAVVGLVIGGIWVAASAVNDHLKSSKTASELASACSRIQQVFQRNLVGSGATSSDITSAAISAGVFPSSWVNGSSVSLPVGGTVVLIQYGSDMVYLGHNIGGFVTAFLVGVPNKSCRQLVPTLFKSGTIQIGAGPSAGSWTRDVIREPGYTGNLSDDCGSEPLNQIAISCNQGV